MSVDKSLLQCSDCSIISNFFCKTFEHVGKHCGVQAGGKFCCFGAQLINGQQMLQIA